MEATLFALFTVMLIAGCGDSSQHSDGLDMTGTAPKKDAIESAFEWSKATGSQRSHLSTEYGQAI